MKRSLLMLALIAVICMAGCGKQEPVSLEYKATEGDPVKYQITMETKTTVEGEGEEAEEAKKEMEERGQMSLDMTVEQKLVEEDGALKNEMVVESGKVIEGKDEEEIDKGEDISCVIKKNGQIVEDFKHVPGLIPDVVFSSDPVGPGDTWSDTIGVPVMNEVMELECKYTVEKFTTVGDLKCAVIKCEIEEKEVSEDKVTMKLSSNANMTFAYEKGYVVDFSVTRNMSMNHPDPDVDASMAITQTVTYKKI